MSTPTTLIPELLHGMLSRESERSLAVSDDSIESLCRLGLGPATFRLTEIGRVTTSRQAGETLRGADLTTRLVYQRAVNAVAEIIAAFSDADIQAILLKGISVAADYYTPPWARVMGDVDILVAPASADRGAEILQSLGYVPDEKEKLDQPHHHLPAVRHPQTGIILELHTGLFPPGTVPESLPLFGVSEWSKNTVASEFEGQGVQRFSPEFQFAYSVAHWATERKWPVSVFPYADAAYLLQDPAFDRERLLAWMQSDHWFATCTALMLCSLRQMQLADPPAALQAIMDSSRKRFGDRSFRALLWLIWTVPLQGRDRACLVINHRAARAAWRSMLSPEHSGSLWAAFRQILLVRFTPLRAALMSAVRTLARAFGLGKNG